MAAINNCGCSFDVPGSFRFDRSSLNEALPYAPRAAAAQPETSRLASSSVEYRASYSESLEYKGYKVFKRAVYSNETLKLFHPKFNSAQPNAASAPSSLEPSSFISNKQSPAQTAKNILGFVEQRLQKHDAAGAPDSELDSLLQQAREGIDKGFDQARDDLEKLGLMTPELSEEIDQSYELALDGLEALKVKFGLAEPAPQTEPVANQTAPAPDEQVPSNSVPVASTNNQVETSSSKTLESSRLSYQSGMRGSIMITTRDGDKVYLDETMIDVLRYKSVTKDDATYSRFASASQFTQELRIVGSLDDEEMAAIQELVDKASDIADLMQSNDFQAALDSALALDFDSSEIAGFALELTRVEVFSSKSVVYKKPTPMNALASAVSRMNEKVSNAVSLLDLLKVSNRQYAEFITNMIPGHHRNDDTNTASSVKSVQAFQSMTQELLRLHRGSDRDDFTPEFNSL